MTTIYNSATVCPYEEQNCNATSTNRLTLDPDISDRMAKSRNFDELKYLWIQWRKASGKLMRRNYKDYVTLMNEVAIGNGYPTAADYWKSDFEDPMFEQNIDKLWSEVKPLYDTLHTYMKYKLIEIYGNIRCDKTVLCSALSKINLNFIV